METPVPMFLRALFAFLALPGIVAGVVPVLIGYADTRFHQVSPVGFVPLAVGLILLLWCVRDFFVSGKGTLAPWDPPKHLVVVGLYRYVRNPMYLAVLTVVSGWGLVFGSAWLGLYLVALAIGFHLRVVLYEEPWLQRQFGAEWQTYLGNVGRWVPRLKADHRNRFRVVLAVCVGVVVCGVTWGVFGQREPVSAGHKIGFWINRLGGPNPNLAVQNVQKIGPAAVPYLMRAVERQPSPMQRLYRELWPQLPLWAKTCLPHPSNVEQLRWNAAIILGRIGSDARPAIPALIRATQNDENYNVRWFAIAALGQIARNDKIVSDAVVRALQDSNVYVRMTATNVLTKIDPEAAAKAGVK